MSRKETDGDLELGFPAVHQIDAVEMDDKLNIERALPPIQRYLT